MNHVIHNSIVNFIWGIADDVLRDVYVRGIEVPEVAEDVRANNDSPLQEEDAADADGDDVIDDEGDMDETD
ncbi:hypothetical protein [Desulfatirhabdium butyrativorans]|uniref:hypothetical protein n=1 Tax=Desulfatirhabdium butyrativorans TaxID=340467 RepID=UPI0003F5ED6E|nr:hypothetical protein [Desulfatirhabdium butyrativorans]